MNLSSLLPIVILSTSVACLADWPQYRGPIGTGVTAERIARPWMSSGPKQLWKTESEGGFSSFAVGGGKAFTLSLKEADGAQQECLVAHDANTGKELWFAPLNFAKYDGGGNDGTGSNKGGDGPRGTPTIVGNTVVTMSSMLALRSFDAATGKVLWTRDLLKDHGGRNIQWQNAASPLLEGGLLYVAGGGSGESILAINPANGNVVWKGFDEKMTHATPVAATIANQRQVIFFTQSGLLSVEPKTGKELWRYAFDFKISTAASPVVWNDIVYCSAGYGVGAGAVKVSNTGGRWEAKELYRSRGNKPLANHWSTPVVKDGYMYGMFQFKEYGNGPIKCVDIRTGDVKWEKEGFGPGHVILAGDKVLALSDEGNLVLIEANSTGYKELARADVLDGKCWTTPVLSGGRVFARSTKEAVCVEVK
jgi:outer membrane protein assembly factor BamB